VLALILLGSGAVFSGPCLAGVSWVSRAADIVADAVTAGSPVTSIQVEDFTELCKTFFAGNCSRSSAINRITLARSPAADRSCQGARWRVRLPIDGFGSAAALCDSGIKHPTLLLGGIAGRSSLWNTLTFGLSTYLYQQVQAQLSQRAVVRQGALAG
jgi:hypothetical protein